MAQEVVVAEDYGVKKENLTPDPCRNRARLTDQKRQKQLTEHPRRKHVHVGEMMTKKSLICAKHEQVPGSVLDHHH